MQTSGGESLENDILDVGWNLVEVGVHNEDEDKEDKEKEDKDNEDEDKENKDKKDADKENKDKEDNDKEDNDKEDKESNLVEVSVHNEGADEDKDKDGRETHFQNWGLPTWERTQASNSWTQIISTRRQSCYWKQPVPGAEAIWKTRRLSGFYTCPTSTQPTQMSLRSRKNTNPVIGHTQSLA